jgi:hypothetical protein
MDKELIESQIALIQDLILTYQQCGATPELIQTAEERLTQLIELAK